MQRTFGAVVGAVLSLGACGEDRGVGAEGAGLAAEDQAAQGASWAARDAGAELTVEDLECPHGGAVGKVEVSFHCGGITTVSCKDLSNVVIETADGSRQRFEGLKGQRGVFWADDPAAVITRVWIKAGANHSGDGPGYGERFEAPAQVCPPTTPPPADAGCFVVDGYCGTPPPPVQDAGCFVADGVCGYIPTPPTPPKQPTEGPIGY